MGKSLEVLVKESSYALVLGIGGGGDVVGTLPTSRYLRLLGIRTLVGGLTWERYVNDPEPGPRKMEEIVEIKRLSATVGLANARTRTTKGIRFTESVVAEVLGEETVLVDLNRGVQGTIDGLNEAIEQLGVDLFVGVDVGGDVLAEGSEESVHSMLADSMVLASMVNLKVPTLLGVLGCGTDGELSFEQFNQQVARIAGYGGFLGARGLTPDDLKVLDEVIPKTKTESSALAVKAARGLQGEIEIREGRRKTMLTPMSAMTLYLDPRVVFDRINGVAKELVPTRSLEEAQGVLERLGVPSELTYERKYVWKRRAASDRPSGGKKMISKRVSEMLRSRVSYPLARKYDVRAAGAINLASNESPYGPSPRVLRALKREAARVSSYPDPRATELRRAIGNYIGVEIECVAIGNGSDELVDLSCKAFLNPGERALIPLPTFAMYELACRVNGGVPKFFKLSNFEWCAAELKRALEGAKLAFIGRPNNPTGNGMSLRDLRGLLASGRLIIVDEAYAEFADDSVAKLATKTGNLLVLRTFSKAFGLAGLRVGYAVGDPKLIEALEGIRAPFNVNRLSQAAAIAALRDKRYMRRVVGKVRRGRTYIRRELTKLDFQVLPSDANFLMVDVSPMGLDASEVCDFLAERKIFVRDLSNFRGAGSDYIRITVGTPRQNERLVETIKQFKGGG